MEVLYGTTNVAKLFTMREKLQNLDIKIISLKDLNINLDVDEVGNNPLENARIKAWEYYKLKRMPTFSSDIGLYIDGLKDEEQPGTYVRRYCGNVLTDEELINRFKLIAEKLGGETRARYVRAICFIIDDGHVYEKCLNDSEFILTSKVHPKIMKGFPMNSIALYPDTRKYHVEPNNIIRENKADLEIKEFFLSSINDYNKSLY